MNVQMNPLPPRERLQSIFRYDPDSGHLFYREPGAGRQLNRPAGSVTGQGYRHVKIDGTFYLAHRVIWTMEAGPIPEGCFIDHRDAVRTNNRLDRDCLDDPARTNLRPATPAENAAYRDAMALRDFRPRVPPSKTTLQRAKFSAFT